MILAQFTTVDVIEIQSARTFDELVAVALRVIDRLAPRGQVALVCGPITTGTRREPKENIRRLMHIAVILQGQGVTVFEHFLFLNQIGVIRKRFGIHDPDIVREQFDLPILKSGKIGTIYLTGEWLRSEGTTWYQVHAKELEIPIKVVQIPHRDTKKAVAAA